MYSMWYNWDNLSPVGVPELDRKTDLAVNEEGLWQTLFMNA
jgi:hypothetical protein